MAKQGIVLILLLNCFLACGQEIKDSLYSIDVRCNNCLDSAKITTTGMMNCFAVARDAWQKEMSRHYNVLIKTLKLTQKQALISAQKAWEAYKDKEFKLCTEIYYDEDMGRERRIDAVARQEEIFRQRALELMRYSDLFHTN